MCAKPRVIVTYPMTTGSSTHAGQSIAELASRRVGMRHHGLLRPFVRVHRSAIINADRLKEIESDSSGDGIIVLADGTKVRLARSRRAAVDRLLGRAF